MKKIIKLFVAAALVLGLASCATVATAPLENYNVTTTQVKLDQANFKVVGSVTGEYEASYIFGVFGGPRKSNATASAVADMYEKANLHGSQAAVNVTTSFKVKDIFGIYVVITYYATCQVIEFE